MFNWTHIDITDEDKLYEMMRLFNEQKDNIIAAGFDTETTGLHIIYDKPFLYQFGWICDNGNGLTFVVDIELQHALAIRTITIWHTLARTLKYFVGHNVKFDLHMCINAGVPYTWSNITDTQCWIRLGSDAVPERKGGAPMALKKFAKMYIDASAKNMDQLLQQERTERASELNLKLKMKLGWTKKQIDTFFKDKVNDESDLPENKRRAYEEWYSLDLPVYLQGKIHGDVDSDDIPYYVLNREHVKYYGHLDVVWTLEIFVKMLHIVAARGNLDGIRRENENIPVLLKMERVGLKVDYTYLITAKNNLKTYIRQRRQDLCTIAQQPLKSSQAKEIMKILHNLGVECDTTNSEVLSRICSDLKRSEENPTAVELIEMIQELRTLEKWYSTYIIRFIKDYRPEDGKLYTQIHQSGTVSGRVTSDFQQFPKASIKGIEGDEIFSPRRMVLAQDGDFKGIVYLDYSQIELRLQAMYTILVRHPDLNLCRAYSPYKCFTILEDGSKKEYNYKDLWCIQHAYDMKWYYEEEPEKHWTPLDVHGATTKIAFNIDETHEDFHALRYKGKRVNFAKNYGAQFGKIKEMFPEYDDETCHRIDDAYYKAFPGVKEYHNYCYNMANLHAYMQNLFGVRYYGASGHNLINMLVQGTGAYYLKWKKVEVDKYLQEHHCKSVLMMEIHDELQFKWHKDDDPQIFFDIKKIMERWDDTYIPIIADMELATSTWADKVEINSKEEFYTCINMC